MLRTNIPVLSLCTMLGKRDDVYLLQQVQLRLINHKMVIKLGMNNENVMFRYTHAIQFSRRINFVSQLIT